MATDVEINTLIDTDRSQAGLKQLRKDLKDLISLQAQVGAGSANFFKLQKAITQTEGKLGDLNDSFKTLRGSGVERLNSSLGLFREGLLSADTDKLELGLQGLGTAMKAIPIFLLIEGAKLLYENFDKVSEFVGNIIGGFNDEARAVKDLNTQYEKQSKLNTQLISDLDNEIKLLKAKQAPIEAILAAEQKSYEIKLSTLKLDKTRQEAILKEKANNEGLLNTVLRLAGVFTLNANLSRIATDNRLKDLSETAVKITEIDNKIAATETDKEVNKIEGLNKLREKEVADRQKRIEAMQEFLKGKNEQEEQMERDRIETENRLHQEELDKTIAFIQEEKNFRAAIKEGESQQDAEISQVSEEKARSKRRRDLDNRIADEKAHQQLSVSERIAGIEAARKMELAQEQLTVDQRVAIIKKAEADILAIKLASAEQTIAISKQYSSVLGELNNFQNQAEDQKLRDLQYKKDASLQEDNNRTQEAIDRETAATNTLLNNEALSSEQKEQIKFASESRILSIQNQSKNGQLKTEQAFAKEQLKVKKHQFEKEKQLKILNIAIDTASALVKTTAELGGVGAITPVGIAMLAGIAALGITEAAVVANSKFDDGGSSVSSIPAAPTIDTRGGAPSSGGRDSRTPSSFNPDARTNAQTGAPVRVVVLESDIRNAANKVDVLESRATFGK